jgi:hypothetical protein
VIVRGTRRLADRPHFDMVYRNYYMFPNTGTTDKPPASIWLGRRP